MNVYEGLKIIQPEMVALAETFVGAGMRSYDEIYTYLRNNGEGKYMSDFEVATLANMFLQLTNFHRHGRKVFNIFPGLMKMLSDTDSDKVKFKDVRMPYPTILLTIPAGYFKSANHQSGNMRQIQDIFVSSETSPEGYLKHLRFFCYGAPDAYRVGELNEDGSIYFKAAGEVLEDTTIGEYSEEMKTPDYEVDEQSVVPIFKAVINILLYINSEKADVVRNEGPQGLLDKIANSTGKKQRKAQEKLTRKFGSPRYDVGRTIVINKKSLNRAEK
jgi:hypothetical protein